MAVEWERDCVLYLRKSKGKAGIERQRKESRAYAQRIRWRVVAEFVEPNTTAFAKIGEEDAPRPEYERMLQFLQRDTRTPALGILAWHADRLSRNTGETRPFTAVCAKGGHLVEAPRSGRYDLSLPIGRKRFRDDISDAEGEVDHLIERVDSSKAERAGEGLWLGGRRGFGFQRDGMTHEPKEADAIRWGCDQVLAGMSTRALAAAWTEQGLRTPKYKTGGGGPFTPSAVKRILVNPRIAGLMVWRGEIQTVRAQWAPIVPEPTWRAVCAVLNDPRRKTTPGPTPRWLGSGLYVCGVCGATLQISSPGGKHGGPTRKVYVCRVSKTHVARDAYNLDAFVSVYVVKRAAAKDAAGLLVDKGDAEAKQLHEDLGKLRGELEEWQRLAEAREVSALAYARMEQRLLADIEAGEAQLTRVSRAPVLVELVQADDPAEVWERLDLDRRRAIVDLLMTVTVHKQRKGRPAGWQPGTPYFDTASVKIALKA